MRLHVLRMPWTDRSGLSAELANDNALSSCSSAIRRKPAGNDSAEARPYVIVLLSSQKHHQRLQTLNMRQQCAGNVYQERVIHFSVDGGLPISVIKTGIQKGLFL